MGRTGGGSAAGGVAGVAAALPEPAKEIISVLEISVEITTWYPFPRGTTSTLYELEDAACRESVFESKITKVKREKIIFFINRPPNAQ